MALLLTWNMFYFCLQEIKEVLVSRKSVMTQSGKSVMRGTYKGTCEELLKQKWKILHKLML